MSMRRTPAVRTALVFLFVSVCAGTLTATRAHAQPAYPVKAIRFIIPFPAPGVVDVVGRIVATGLESLGQPVVVENRAGAAGILGTELAARAAPDGYTLVLGSTASFTIVPHIRLKLPYDPVKDFVPVAPFARSTFALIINAGLPVRSVKEFIAYAKERPGQLNYVSNGNGGILHLAMEMFSSMAGIRMTHVPYNNAVFGLNHIASGELQAMFISPATAMPLIKAGRLRALAVGTAHRSEIVPDIPTVQEEGLTGFDLSTWYGLFAPAGTSRNIVSTLNATTNAALKQADIADRLRKGSAERWPGTPETLAAVVRAELEMYGKVARDTGLQKE
jgi:tripartite-type tricarboxylate transporter receptor subunit TctC